MPHHIVVEILRSHALEVDVYHALQRGVVVVHGLDVEAIGDMTISWNANVGNAICVRKFAIATMMVCDEY